MNITDHGTWVRYTPDPWPKDYPSFVMFCKNVDGIDWYDYIKSDKLSPVSIKMTVFEDIVRAVYRDASMLFPQGCLVLEIPDDPVLDPQAKYGGKLYDAESNSFSDPPPLSPQPNIDETITELFTRNRELRKRIEALETK
jgi:hypothetical protein